MNDLDTLLAELDNDNGHTDIIPTVDASGPITAIPQEKASELDTTPIIDIPKHVKMFEMISSEILGTWRADREEAQSAINLLRDMIEEQRSKATPPPGTWLEAYVGAIKAKGDANATVSKLLDSTIKLLQTSKQPTTKQQTTTHNTQYNLTQILNDPILDDDV